MRPENNKITVFNKGTEKGSKKQTPKGGQIEPTKMEGANLL